MIRDKTWRYAALPLALASLISILPLLIFDIGGDSAFHLVLIQCFSHQFWQGDLYPRWCMEANAGLGTPLFLFYFPLPYYLTALLYPLTYLGVTLYGLMVIGMALASFATGLTCFHWLKSILTPPRALPASLLFMFIPYRMEAMLFRAAYAELWGLAIMPLVFAYTRRLAQGENRAWLPLAASFGLLFTAHLPQGIIAVLMAGTYLLILSPRQWPGYAQSVATGFALAAFYIVPAIAYRRFMAHDTGPIPWANTYFSMRNITELGQGRVALTILITLLAFVALGLALFFKRRDIDDTFIRRECAVWGIIAVLGLFMLLPASALIYVLAGPLNAILFPWRMQSAFAFALIWLIAVWLRCFVTPRRLKTWKADMALLFSLLVLMSYFVVGVLDETSATAYQNIVRAEFAVQPEYRTQWIPKEQFTDSTIIARLGARPSKITILSGKGQIALMQTRAGAIDLLSKSTQQLSLRLDHYYFPLWAAHDESGAPLTLSPELQSGMMMLDIPPGNHHIFLRVNGGWITACSDMISIIALLFLVWRFRKLVFDKPAAA